MAFRVTPQTLLARQAVNLRRQGEALARLQEQASTGLKLLRPSDAPADAAAAIRAKADDGRLGANQANVNTARARLEQANAGLLDANRLLTRAREAGLDGASDGTDAAALEALAVEVDNLIDRLLSLGNARADGRSVFAGTATATAPFVVTAVDGAGRPAVVSYQGSDTAARVTVGREQEVEVSPSGAEALQRPGQDAFAALIGLRDLLRNAGGLSPAAQREALSAQVGAVEQAQAGVLEAVGELSAGLESLDGLEARLGEVRGQTKIAIGDLESADLAEVVVSLTAQQTLYQNTLQIAARAYDQNLFDLLR